MGSINSDLKVRINADLLFGEKAISNFSTQRKKSTFQTIIKQHETHFIYTHGQLKQKLD